MIFDTSIFVPISIFLLTLTAVVWAIDKTTDTL